MNIRKIQIQASDIDCFKIEILKTLNLFNYKQDCLIDFDDRLDNFFKRNSNLKVLIEIKREKLFDEIYNNKWSKLERYKRTIPEDYPFGASNMETQAYYDPIVCDDKYYRDVEKAKKDSISEFNDLVIMLNKLEKKEKLEIEIK